jgi:hypothetical protein
MAVTGTGSGVAAAGVPIGCEEDGRVAAGTTRLVDGQERVYYEGYWIKTYPVPEDTLQAKKHLIEALTRRLFNHTEHGLNIPGHRMAEARRAYEAETDPGRKRVKGAMYAGALFNRATNIFTRLVDLQSTGVEISANNDLMRECGRCLQEALSLCRLVLHRSGEEGIDELWGEPFRAFCIPLERSMRAAISRWPRPCATSTVSREPCRHLHRAHVSRNRICHPRLRPRPDLPHHPRASVDAQEHPRVHRSVRDLRRHGDGHRSAHPAARLSSRSGRYRKQWPLRQFRPVRSLA